MYLCSLLDGLYQFWFILTYYRLFLQFPLDLDPWELLQRHLLSDYVNNEVKVT